MAKIIDIDDHGQPREDMRFKLKINKDQGGEIMSYHQLMDYIQKGTDAEEDPDSLFSLETLLHTKDHLSQLTLIIRGANTIHWQDAMDLELTQIHEYKVFQDTGKAQFHNGK